MTFFRFPALSARQADDHDVFVFAAEPKQVLEFAQIERVGRSDSGELKGFQRHQISSHIREIRTYMARDDALLPNALIVAFLGDVDIQRHKDGRIEIEIDVRKGPPGFVVDGQQRLTALSGLDKPGFQVFVSALICKDYDQLRQQFVLINSTRPLPKTLIYELLPTVEGLPERYSARRFAARVVERLNFCGSQALRAQIRQHTNPAGVISDTAMQKLVMNSAAHGAIRDLITYEDREDRAVALIDEFFTAVAKVFGGEWTGMAPRHSRLRHGAGIVAMGFVMDLLYANQGAVKAEDFVVGLELLKPYTAWTSGIWKMAEYEIPWNDIQNTPSDIDLLTRHLVSATKRQLRRLRRAANE
ncbi:DGQHR domain-containing protein DpdB [Ramlibacter alkalitolerans]|uniref:DGQHR domain-containing protein n=1 Tax=Ramlibacter alkalitolerans TaxID=2039631 RepID=A0ABS1JUJ9_9BURK|nr:DGQHR domain-containing protein DpdB [Ramlibacter alkalitolerans]MBL0427970.1 DGQHR domain-containing protein [Ramlibacter alkalitolerans]